MHKLARGLLVALSALALLALEFGTAFAAVRNP
jgi:hypothetical protein